jgi:beta-carotene hydroxylase
MSMPSLRELGADLLVVPRWRRVLSLTMPFCWCAAYFVFAALDWWPAAVFSLMALSFVTYGSISHDLVHRCLGLNRRTNDILLCVIELLALRCGHAYQAAHLNHHARFPHTDDVEAKAAGRSWWYAIAEGVVLQPRIWFWAMRQPASARTWIMVEGIACAALFLAAVAMLTVTPIFIVYVALMIMGSWTIPLITSYLPHDPHAKTELTQTRAYRGRLASIIAMDHLYHLEHHLYPSVPHHNWPTLARRLDPHFARAGVNPIRFWI